MKEFPDVLAPFVPTPPEIVERVLKLAGLSADDVVYDLGCGDARILVAAARTCGARGVGFETGDGQMKLARASVDESGLGHLIELRQRDAMTADLAPATVVTLYLSHFANVALQPIIRRDCRPGTRIVSLSFPMPGWEPEKTERFADATGSTRTLFLWRVTR